MNQSGKDGIRAAVRNNYRKFAVAEPAGCGCETESCCGSGKAANAESISVVLGYSAEELASIPESANLGLGCGNPIAEAELKQGETVLDLGSGGGIDCFLASRAVGAEGRVIGVDMTPEMVSKARKTAEESGFNNVDFRLGEIENLPAGDSTVDAVISNCVINLSPDKEKVFRECFRVLKKGGRIAVSDIVATAALPDDVKNNLAMYTGCMAGASHIKDLEEMMRRSGFHGISIKPKGESREFISEWSPGSSIEDYVVSAVVKAVK
ncbi:arsenite methyltransferase [Geovibrio thiophilus]|uniref:Arsenite methyltransferase n=1 Tax=Geovibrio thiophilus TaxID=139438 RepID=A0A410JX75_9BACT|nr:arsenite methyltransferase [Geovibrio thiophilus]QAR32635.1 arsenite methyltransferase [Geovibrio thiophilus]